MTPASSPEAADSQLRSDRGSLSRRNRRSLALLVGTGILSVLLFGAISRIADFPILDTLWWASAETVRETLSNLSPARHAAYRLMLVIDYLYAGAYTAFLVAAISLSRPKEASPVKHQVAGASKLRRLIFRTGVTGAVLTGTLDAIENSIALILLARLPQASPLAVAIGTVTSLKWVAAGTAGSVLLVQLLLRAGTAVRRRIRP